MYPDPIKPFQKVKKTRKQMCLAVVENKYYDLTKQTICF